MAGRGEVASAGHGGAPSHDLPFTICVIRMPVPRAESVVLELSSSSSSFRQRLQCRQILHLLPRVFAVLQHVKRVCITRAPTGAHHTFHARPALHACPVSTACRPCAYRLSGLEPICPPIRSTRLPLCESADTLCRLLSRHDACEQYPTWSY